MIGFCKKCRDTKVFQLLSKDQLPTCVLCGQRLINLSEEMVTLSEPRVRGFNSDFETNQGGEDGQIPKKPTIYFHHFDNAHLLECEDRLKHKPDDVEALLFMGKWHKSKGNVKQAIDKLSLLVQTDHSHLEALKHLGDLYLATDDFDKAVKVMERLHKLEGDEEIVLYNLGIAYLYKKSFDKAYNLFSKIKYRTENSDLRNKVSQLLTWFDDKVD